MDDTPEFTDRQREFLTALPATSKEIADEMGISTSSVRDHREAVQERGVKLDYDEATHVWSRVDGGSGDLEGDEDTTFPDLSDMPVADVDPDPSDLNDDERVIARKLPRVARDGRPARPPRLPLIRPCLLRHRPTTEPDGARSVARASLRRDLATVSP